MTDPILLDFPDQIETGRLLIRACRPGDGAAYFEAIAESLDSLRPWIRWATPELTAADVEKQLRKAVAQWQTREDLRLSIWRKSDGLLIGGSGLHRIDWDTPRLEIGYWVRTGCEGQGYITETVIGVRDFAFETLKAQRVEIRCEAENERSAAVARRAAFPLEARLRHNSRNTQGELVDILVFALLRDEWAALVK